MKHINADKLIAEIDRLNSIVPYESKDRHDEGLHDAYKAVKNVICSLQQDEKAVELEMCSQAYWEERGWMMIPPDVTLKGIESLLEQVRKKLQQEQHQVADASKMELPEMDLEKELYDYICSDEYLNTRGDGSLLIARHFYGLRNRALEEAARHVYESWMGGTMDDVRRDMVELGTVLNVRKEE